MDTVKSIMGYGKVEEAQDIALKRKTRKQLLSVVIAAVVLVAIVIGAVIAGVAHSRKNESSRPSSNEDLTPAASIKTVCSVTLYPDSCISSISKIPSSNTTDPEIIFRVSLKVVVDALASITDLPKKLAGETEDEKLKSSLNVCGEMFDSAMDRINATVSAMEVSGGGNIWDSRKIDDLQTWLTSVLTYYDTCIDALDIAPNNKAFVESQVSKNLKSAIVASTIYTSNSLSIVAKVLSTLSEFKIPIHRRLLNSKNSFPSWVIPGVRRLLQVNNLTPDVTVAADGSGDVKTVNEAIARIPNKSETRFLIYVKAGKYVENVVMDKNMWNVMVYGDGQDKTIISGSQNCIDGIKTYYTATFGVQGQGFIMKDIGIINTAGPEKHQAVAFRSGSDYSVCYRCSFDGYQDTLYTHSGRQFYRDCDVTGTVDFIFGNAAALFQNCNIRPRQPLPDQFNTITAQGKNESAQNTGISIQRCKIFPNGDVTVPTYLGRPWKTFSTTVIMETEIRAIVSGVGWVRWDPNNDPPSSIYYGEYKNSGPGSGLFQRVNWAGYKPVMSDAEAGQFTAATFINGAAWLPATGSPYQLT